ncbi:MAG: ECF transporter S component, partial [Promethearchaeota archaeon]
MKKSRICLIFLLFYSGLILILPLFEDLTWLNPNESAKGIILNILVIFSVFSLGMYFRLEENQLSTKELTFIAIYSTFTAIIRIPFMGLPNIQPCTYLIFSAGIVFGPLIGFMIGANTALISNIFLGQGPWTIYQIIAWGLVGIIGGFCRIKTEKLQKLWVRILFAFIGILL